MVNIQNVFYQIDFCKNKNIQESLANFIFAKGQVQVSAPSLAKLKPLTKQCFVAGADLF